MSNALTFRALQIKILNTAGDLAGPFKLETFKKHGKYVVSTPKYIMIHSVLSAPETMAFSYMHEKD
jgi:hypothetical protein